MTNMLSYQGEFLNTETTRPDNQANQQLIEIRIYDTEAPVTDNAFGIRYKTAETYDGFITATVTWDALPEAATAAAFGWYDGTWHDLAVDPLAGSAVLKFPDTAVQNWGFLIDYAVGFDTRVQLRDIAPTLLEMAEYPYVSSTINNEEDKFSNPVQGKTAEIQVYSSSVVDADNFFSGGDKRFSVEIDYPYIATQHFRGFLSMGDIEQDFQPDPNIITLVAVDGLGFTNDLPLVTFDGDNPMNEHPAIMYLSWALALTGQRLEIDIAWNIREQGATPLVSDDSGDGHLLKWCYLNAKTFEDEIGLSIPGFDVLTQLTFGGTLVQHNGRWRIIRVDEREIDKPYTFYRFDAEGNFLSKFTEGHQKEIGFDLPLSWMNDDTLKSAQRDHKSISLDFNYTFPEEIPCNSDLSRGVGPVPEADENSTLDYEPECIEYFRESASPTIANLDQPPSADSYGILRKVYEGGQQKENYLYGHISTGFRHYFKFEEIPVGQNDKIEFSFNFRSFGDSSLTNVYPLLAILYGNDGSYWLWNYDQPTDVSSWVQKAAGDSPFFDLWHADLSGVDAEEWQGISATSKPLPVSGKLVFRLLVANTTYDMAFSDLSVRYILFINGSYPNYSGHRNSVTNRVTKSTAARTDEIFIDSAPAIIIKGAWLIETEDGFGLANGFYDASRLPDGPPDVLLRYGQLLSFDVWNQFNRVMMQFEGTVDGLDSGVAIPDITNTYILTDADRSTNNRLFMVLHYEQDHHLCEFNLFLQELQDSTKLKVYEGHEFKYITSNE